MNWKEIYNIQYLKNEKTMKEISKLYNCCYDRVRDNFRKNNFKLRTSGEASTLKKKQREKKYNVNWNLIGEEYNNGASLGMLSDKYFYSVMVLSKNLKQHGFKIRTGSEAEQVSIEQGRHVCPNKGKFRENHSSWKGGFRIQIDERGKKRQMIYIGDKTYISYSQYVWMKHNNKKCIPKGFCIHHKDFNTLNDNINNLELLTISNHSILHNKKRRDDKNNFCRN